VIVSNSSPIIYFSRIGKLIFLREVYDELLIPQGVYKELVEEGTGLYGVNAIKKAISQGWIKTESVKIDFDYEAEGIEEIDAEVIVLAKKYDLPLLSNDKALILCAKAHDVTTKWLAMSVIEGIDKGVISKKEAENLLVQLVDSGLRIRSEVFAELLKMIEERRN
jgi:predicted nucleic acid-binding protein